MTADSHGSPPVRRLPPMRCYAMLVPSTDFRPDRHVYSCRSAVTVYSSCHHFLFLLFFRHQLFICGTDIVARREMVVDPSTHVTWREMIVDPSTHLAWREMVVDTSTHVAWREMVVDPSTHVAGRKMVA